MALRSWVRAFHALSRGAAGSRAISHMLRQSGIDAEQWLARRLMQECGLISCQPAKHQYRMGEEPSPALPNLLQRQFYPTAPNRVWGGGRIVLNGAETGIRAEILLEMRRQVFKKQRWRRQAV